MLSYGVRNFRLSFGVRNFRLSYGVRNFRLNDTGHRELDENISGTKEEALGAVILPSTSLA